MDIIVVLYNFVRQHKLSLVLVGFILMLILGGIVGRQLFPTEWINATPLEMRHDFRDDYLVWVAQKYEADRDLEGAREKLFGYEYWKDPDWYQKVKGELNPKYQKMLADVAQRRAEAGDATAVSLTNLLAAMNETDLHELEVEEPGGPNLLTILGTVCLVGLVAAALVGGGFFLYRRLRGGAAEEAPGRAMAERLRPVSPAVWGAEGPPLAQYPTTYTLGDDHYDPSFSIELETGEFMGECGVGISETIGVGAPNKVTAFEVWLFDKSDIRTVTRVLMSDYAYHDEALRTKLAPKGEPVLVGEGKEVVLETKTLQVKARVVETQYGTGNLPPNSFFERFSIDLIAWVKQIPEGMEAEEVPSLDALSME